MKSIIRKLLLVMSKLRLISPITITSYLKKKELIDTIDECSHLIVATQLLGYTFFYEPLRTTKKEIKGSSGLGKMLEIDNYNLELLSNNTSPVILDIGSHIGIWPRVIKSKYAEAKIYSLEPDRDNFRILQLNNAPIPGAESFQYGIYEKKTKITLRASDQNSWRSSLNINPDFFRNDLIGNDTFSYDSYEVTCISIDDFVIEQKINRVDMIGVTVPGEIALSILKGGVKTMDKYHPIISISLYPSETDDAKKILKSYGYVMASLPKGNMHTFVYDGNRR